MEAAILSEHSTRRQRGVSLIEFMVAMLLGTILIGGAVTLYLASQRSFVESERAGELSDNGRFALQLINDTLRHAGFSGDVRPGISFDASSQATPPAADCSDTASAMQPADYLYAADPNDPSFATCLDGADGAKGGTDVLVIKSLQAFPIYDANPVDPNDPGASGAILDGVLDFPQSLDTAETTYIIANAESGILVDPTGTAPSVNDSYNPYFGGKAWPYQYQIFYVREANAPDRPYPTLARKVLQWGGGTNEISEPEDLVVGVEDVRYRFGWDSNGDGEVDTFGSHEDLAAGDWRSVLTVEAFVLVRSLDQDHNYQNEKSYTLADEIFTPDGVEETKYHRLLVNSSILLRNPKLRLGGG